MIGFFYMKSGLDESLHDILAEDGKQCVLHGDAGNSSREFMEVPF